LMRIFTRKGQLMLWFIAEFISRQQCS
jgi:hypothetical protein